MENPIHELLCELDIHPVLVDIGAAGPPPEIWDGIAPQSIYVGFDPDLRQIEEVSDGQFHRGIMVNEAVTASSEKQLSFYLTKSASCSSTLKPDTDSLGNYTFADLFKVEKEVKVPATTLNSVIERFALPGIDWFKTDSQGTDLRLFESLRDEIGSRVLAVDIEPGLIDAYVGEDLFVGAHAALIRKGFWLSNLNVCGTVRMRSANLETIAHLGALERAEIEGAIRRTPCWVEARYFRTIRSLLEINAGKREFVLLWCFALIDNQPGFALDLALEYERLFGRDQFSQTMLDYPMERIREIARPQPEVIPRKLSIGARIIRKLKRLLGQATH